MKTILRFLKRLAANNNRKWFKAHKDEYLDVKQRVEMLASQLISIVAMVDPEASMLTASKCTYRIYRDTRFSPDKTPYKTHIGIFINPPEGKQSITGGYYFHIESGDMLAAAGTVCLPGKVIAAIRKSIYDEIDEYRAIVEDPEFKTLLPDLGMNKLKTAPRGVDKTWPWIDYIRPRDFIASGPLPDDFFDDFDLEVPIPGQAQIDKVLPYVKHMCRYNRFVNFTIEDFADDPTL